MDRQPQRKSENESSLWGLVASGLAKGFGAQLNVYMSFSNLNTIRQRVKAGDLLEFHRGLFSHYALYLGEGKVMNVCGEDIHTTEALIKEMKLEDVCKSSPVRIRNHDDVAKRYFHVNPKLTFEIVRDARSFQNQVLPYQFDFRNCEYYSTLWRYGKGFSTQVAKPTKTPAGGLLGGIMEVGNSSKGVLQAAEVFMEAGIYTRYIELARK
ncbi:Phospholipid-metabolizing enzyme A-C1 [Orchesella cincta]|uniref:Phospholipid-metabolizing enzyme A-C1 n=1 Tax=Orchesella cincta TaxID=48709 RepID=A0A1D2MM30_ORCCI|nr:Phospholipid-metabolizing enzyme A-C1 [Orchesella cincta]